jgi:hypothetical protein
MTRNDIIRMARKAGYTGLNDPWLHELARKAYAAGAAAEREACAKACEDDPSKAGEWTEDAHTGGYYAEIIRARGQA